MPPAYQAGRHWSLWAKLRPAEPNPASIVTPPWITLIEAGPCPRVTIPRELTRELTRTQHAGWTQSSRHIGADRHSPSRGFHAAFGPAVQVEVIRLRAIAVCFPQGPVLAGPQPRALTRPTRIRPDAGAVFGMGFVPAELPGGERLVFDSCGYGPDEPTAPLPQRSQPDSSSCPCPSAPCNAGSPPAGLSTRCHSSPRSW